MPTTITVRYISYEVETLSTDRLETVMKAINPGAYAGNNPPPNLNAGDLYFRLLADHLADNIERRVSVLPEAQAIGQHPHTLIVFAAPEFYFKDKGGMPFDRAVVMRGLDYLKSKVMALGKNLLVLPGTIWWKEDNVSDPAHVIVHNTMPILSNHQIIHTWQKKNLSGIDGLKHGSQQWDADNKAVRAVLDSSQVPIFQYDLNGTPIKIGLEVCLDHSLGVLHGSGQQVDMHLLVACGMSINTANIAASTGGVMLRCEGHPAQPALGRSNVFVWPGHAPVPANPPFHAFGSRNGQAAMLNDQVAVFDAITFQK